MILINNKNLRKKLQLLSIKNFYLHINLYLKILIIIEVKNFYKEENISQIKK